MADLNSDRNVGRGVSLGLRVWGHSVVTTEDLGLETTTDDVQLLTAAQTGRILLTHNRKDFLLLHLAWRGWTHAWNIDPPHAGIVVPLQTWTPEQEIDEIDELLRRIDTFTNDFHSWERDVRAWERCG